MYSEYVKELCKNKSAIGLSKSKPEIVAQLLEETQFLDILSPSYTLRKYCVENDIFSIPLCEQCGNITSVNRRDNKHGFNRFCSDSCRKAMSKIPKESLEKLIDKDWLYDQRIVQKKSKDTIAEELGVSHTTINKWIKYHDLPVVRYNECQIDFSKTLENYEWLYEQYVILNKTADVISEEIECHYNQIYKYLNFFDITPTNQFEYRFSTESYEKLNSKEWMYEHYFTKRISSNKISKILECSPSSVLIYLKQHGIPIRKSGENKLTEFTYIHLTNFDWMWNHYIDKHLSTYQIGNLLNCSDTCVAKYLSSHGIEIRKDHSISSYEIKIRDFLDSHGITYYSNVVDKIAPYHIDIFIPSNNIGIEINGVYWHCEEYKDNNYHKMKYDRCKNIGIELIHLYEDDIVNRFDIVTRILKNRLNICDDEKIHARKCTIVKNVDKKYVSEFFEKYHIQGYVGNSYNICLEHNGEIVAGMIFNSNRLERFVTSKKVLGGFSKLLKHSGFEEIITFLDIQTFSGKSYFDNGFIIEKYLYPDYKYVVRDIRVHKFNYRKKRFITDSKLKYDENMTEHELAILNKIYRIYDCGKLKLKWINHAQ